jgi:hypothetical protein
MKWATIALLICPSAKMMRDPLDVERRPLARIAMRRMHSPGTNIAVQRGATANADRTLLFSNPSHNLL